MIVESERRFNSAILKSISICAFKLCIIKGNHIMYQYHVTRGKMSKIDNKKGTRGRERKAGGGKRCEGK